MKFLLTYKSHAHNNILHTNKHQDIRNTNTNRANAVILFKNRATSCSTYTVLNSRFGNA